ncbi:shikimate kinase [Bizionia paragorgiae]|uniref:shikimate kinase n=1 Tax=Bizionia paragorgiae TaxID=283786 RepID=UPI003A95739A
MKIIILGYMASGKSFIGKQLAKKANYQFIDLDNYIEEKENKSVKSIFETQGELYFRKVERNYLMELLDGKDDVVISLGGGTPCYYNNMVLIKSASNTRSVYLRASIPTLVTRLKSEKEQRPLISHIETDDLLTEFIGKHLFERSNFYNLSDITINANNSAEIILKELQDKLF